MSKKSDKDRARRHAVAESFRRKASAILGELSGMNSCEGHEPRVAERITATLTRKRRPGFWRIGKKKAREIGHHLTDWSSEAVFLVALHLKPERFTTAEIDAGVGAFLIHASYHVASAAALYGFPVTDIVDVTMLPRNEPGKARGRKRERKPEAG